jgi:hypothetical protein
MDRYSKVGVFDLKKKKKKFSAVIFFQFLVIKALDPDRYSA